MIAYCTNRPNGPIDSRFQNLESGLLPVVCQDDEIRVNVIERQYVANCFVHVSLQSVMKQRGLVHLNSHRTGLEVPLDGFQHAAIGYVVLVKSPHKLHHLIVQFDLLPGKLQVNIEIVG